MASSVTRATSRARRTPTRDVPGVNLSTEYRIEQLDPDGEGTFEIDRTGASTSQFFPLDDGDGCPVTPHTPCLLGNWPAYPTHNFT